VIADDVMECLAPDRREWFTRQLAESTVVKVQNVADYQRAGTAQEWWDIRDDFPNIAPPWGNFWMEWRQPEHVRSDKLGTHGLYRHVRGDVYADPMAGVRWAVLGQACDVGSDPVARQDGVRWALSWVGFSPDWYSPRLDAEQATPALLLTFVNVDADGRATEVKGAWQLGRPLHPSLDGREDATNQVSHLLRNVVLLAFSFAHCKNVSWDEGRFHGPLIKRRAERGRAPITRWLTLRIDPMREVLRREGGADRVGLAKALHICRGHFKHYDRGRPLFGKHEGTYWWPMHRRGSTAIGEIKKDYEVKAPIE
jgi:hypothetical protein